MLALTRSDFLKLAATFGGGLILGVGVSGCSNPQAPSAGATFAPSAWLSLGSDEMLTLYVPHSEMGQGVATGIATLVADELDLSLDRVRTVFADSSERYLYPGEKAMFTGGSTSIERSWKPMRTAGATVRAMLVEAAAQQWGVDPSSCTTNAGLVHHAPSGRSAAYGTLVADAAKLHAPAHVTLKEAKQFTLIGRTVQRTDIPPKTDGSAMYGMDVTVPGMLYASVERPAVFGATVAHFDATAAKKVANVVDVVKISSGVAVVATNTWAAFQGRKALVVAYHEGENAEANSAAFFARSETLAHDSIDGRVAMNVGDVDPPAGVTMEALYKGPFLAHAPMEPMNATADVRADRVELWAPTQFPTGAQQLAAKITGVPLEKCTVHVPYLGGGFGRRYLNDFVVDALEVSKAMAKPVKVVWTREDDIQHDWYRPMSVNRISGTVGADGTLRALDITVVGEAVRRYMHDHWDPKTKPRPIDGTVVGGADDFPYDIPNRKATFVDYQQGIPTLWWRAPGANWNVFVIESFIDELAHRAGKDPVAFRLAMLGKQPRLAQTLRVAAQRANWGKTASGVFQGVALTWWGNTVGALVADITMNGAMPKLEHVTCVIDCGRVVNPDIVVSQTQSAINYGWSAALNGKITIKNGRVEQANFDTYTVLRMKDAPSTIDVITVESTADPSGIGEPGTPPVAPAVANALFAATGKRVRSLPLTDALA